MNCAICGDSTKAVIELPGFPGGDQTFLQCQSCGHGMLATRYEQTCGYSSGQTEYSRRGVAWFLSFISGEFECALDFGCNDGHLVKCIPAKRRIGVDPGAKGLYFETYSSLEPVDIAPDLIVSRHTLEHVPDPLGTLRDLVAKAAPHAQIVIEVPCLDALVEAFRFDQIYNEHLHYFSIGSFNLMLRAAGLKVQRFAMHNHPISMLAVCVKGQDRAESFTVQRIDDRYAAFRRYTQSVGNILALSNRRMAYGASFIFPVLLYHIGLAPDKFATVLDDDRAKWGTDFHGLTICQPCFDASDAAVLVTAPDSFDSIYRKLDGHAISAVPMI